MSFDTLAVSVHGVSVRYILEKCRDTPRTKHGLESWSGSSKKCIAMRKRKFNCGYWDKVFEDRIDLLSPEGVEEWGKELMSLGEEPARSSVRKLEMITGQIYLSTGFLLRRSSKVENPPKLDPALHLNRVARIPKRHGHREFASHSSNIFRLHSGNGREDG